MTALQHRQVALLALIERFYPALWQECQREPETCWQLTQALAPMSPREWTVLSRLEQIYQKGGTHVTNGHD